jgi:8-oxo-dGTP pyrophosphatase MutT (NUDIX family)
MERNDLQFQIENSILNLRAVALIRTPKGYLFEKCEEEYYVPIGGKMKVEETTAEAVIREIQEEINLELKPKKMKAVIENFFFFDLDKKFHEINFVYELEADIDILPEDFFAFTLDEVSNLDIRPLVIKDVLLSKEEFVHIVNKER